MMIRALLLAFGLLCATIAPASAQGCGPTNPNCVVVTAPNGDNSTKAASTAFVQAAFGGGSSLALASGKILIGQVSGFATAQTPSGDLALSNAGVFTFNTVNANVGTFGSATTCITATVNGKGQITAISATACTVTVGSISGLGANVATALGIGVGSAGAFVTFNGALGTPSSGTATNLTGTAAGLTAGNVTTNANLTGPITSSGNATTVASQTGTGSTFVMNTSPVLVTPTLGVALATSLQFSPSTGGIIGTPTNNNATGGVVGEYISSSIASGSAVALTTGTAANITSISLTAGDWDISGEVNFIGGATTTVGIFAGSISTTTATMALPPSGGYYASTMFNNVGLTTFNPTCPLSNIRLSLSGTTTVFLVGFMNFATSTASAFGFIGARRIR